jgi:flagellar protein FliO/FliZ
MQPLGATLLLLLLPAPVYAADSLSMGSAVLQMSWALLIVVGLILALYGLTKKRLLLGKMGGNAIKIIEMRALMPKSTLALVEVRGKEYLLGVGSDGIRLLVDLSQDDAGSKKPDFESVLAEQQ